MVSVESVIRVIDMLDTEGLWKLAITDPVGVMRTYVKKSLALLKGA